jgi:3,4-dihydroxy 2-butanone 4-phosphate synthase/GTP cyclohydrolase II
MNSKKEFTREVVVKLPSRFGFYTLYGYVNSSPDHYHLAVVKGNVTNKGYVPTRIHSSCITGDILGSQRCDCRAQLEYSLEYIEKQGIGIVLYLFQEGRGIGLINKLKAYKLQEEGLDTVEANEALGFPADLRRYNAAKDILDDLHVRSVRLLTNNPDKIKQLREYGVNIVNRIPVIVGKCEHNERYLKTKKEKMNHLLDYTEALNVI